MSAIFFGLIGSVFSAFWLGWMLKNKRTPDRRLWQPPVTAVERPGAYWGEVLFVGFFLIMCVGLLADGLLK
jgi:hypothetical protein